MPHWITAARGDAQPCRLVCVDVDAQFVGRPDDLGVEDERLVSWSADGWSADHKGNVRFWSRAGASLADWWACHGWASRQSGVTWIVAHQCCRAMALLDVWGAIERKEVCLDGSDVAVCRRGNDATPVLPEVRRPVQSGGQPSAQVDPGLSEVLDVPPTGRRRRAAAKPHSGEKRGYACLEDPPTVVRTRCPALPGRLVWHDLRNWGIEAYPAALSVQVRSRWALDIMRRLVDTLKVRGWGGLKATAGSQALATWRRAFLTHAVHCHTDETALHLERAAYVGGRVECGRLGHVDGPVYHLDVRSLYPSVCVSQALPAVLQAVGSGALPRVRGSDHPGSACIAEVSILTDEPGYPCVTSRPTVYPVGRFRTVLCGPELVDALERSRIVSVGRWASYLMSPALSAYARAVYTWRCECEAAGDVPLAQVAKRLLVALPGKLGQRGWHWEEAPGLRPEKPWMVWYEARPGLELVRLRNLGGWCQREKKEDWANDAVGAMASWICSAGRLSLLRGIRVAGWAHVHYYDTDSLVVDECGYRALLAVPGLVGAALGQWRLIGVYPSAHFWGQKHYRLGDVVKCAGLPGGSCQPGPLPDYWWYRRGARRALGEHARPSAGRTLVPYLRRAQYRVGARGSDGRVFPLVRNEW